MLRAKAKAVDFYDEAMLAYNVEALKWRAHTCHPNALTEALRAVDEARTAERKRKLKALKSL